MNYSIEEKTTIRSQIIQKVSSLIDSAFESDSVTELLERFGIELGERTCILYNRTSKILVLGELSGKKEDYKRRAKHLGVNPENLEFVDYSQCKKFNVAKLEYSSEYTDIICGPMPHKMVGMGDTSSFLAEVEKEPNKYPKVLRCTSNGGLKISVSGFAECVEKSRYLQEKANMVQ